MFFVLDLKDGARSAKSGSLDPTDILKAFLTTYNSIRYVKKENHIMSQKPVPPFAKPDNCTFCKCAFLQVMRFSLCSLPEIPAGGSRSPGKTFPKVWLNVQDRLPKRSGSFDQTFEKVFPDDRERFRPRSGAVKFRNKIML